ITLSKRWHHCSLYRGSLTGEASKDQSNPYIYRGMPGQRSVRNSHRLAAWTNRLPGPLPSRQGVQQRLRLLQVGGVKALGEPAVDRDQQLAGFVPLALALPQPAQAHGGPQLQGLGLLAASYGQRLLKTVFCLVNVPGKGGATTAHP